MTWFQNLLNVPKKKNPTKDTHIPWLVWVTPSYKSRVKERTVETFWVMATLVQNYTLNCFHDIREFEKERCLIIHSDA